MNTFEPLEIKKKKILEMTETLKFSHLMLAHCNPVFPIKQGIVEPLLD